MRDLTTTHIAVLLALAGVAVIVAMLLVRRANRPPSTTATKGTRKTHTFLARDSRGHPVLLDVFQQYVDAGARDDPHAQRKGVKHIMTGDGRRVEKIGTRKYRIAGTTEVLTSDDAEAP